MLHQRYFDDGVDLNNCFPGDNEGKASQQYAYQLANTLITQFTHFVDFHSASRGRADSFYIRADMSQKKKIQMFIKLLLKWLEYLIQIILLMVKVDIL